MPLTEFVGSGGVTTVGRELGFALARQGHHIILRAGVPPPGTPEFNIENLTVQGLDPVPGIGDRGQLLRSDGLPPAVDVVIGHSRFTGGAAAYLRDQFYPEAKLVNVVHTSPDDLDRYRDDPQQSAGHAETEQHLIAKADVVMGVGPLLTEEAARLARIAHARPIIAELPPGVAIGEPAPRTGPQRQLNVLMFGRIDDHLKGGDIAAGLVRELRQVGHDVRLTMLGASPESVPDHERRLAEQSESIVRVKPFTSDRRIVTGEILGADFVVMPSRVEGFGLVATEALGYGVPTFVSPHSGAGHLLSDPTRIPEQLGQLSVVPERPGSTALELVRAWAEHIEPLIRLPERLAATREAFLILRQHLAKHFTWDHSANAVIEAIRQCPDPAVRQLGTGQGPTPNPDRLQTTASRTTTTTAATIGQRSWHPGSTGPVRRRSAIPPRPRP